MAVDYAECVEIHCPDSSDSDLLGLWHECEERFGPIQREDGTLQDEFHNSMTRAIRQCDSHHELFKLIYSQKPLALELVRGVARTLDNDWPVSQAMTKMTTYCLMIAQGQYVQFSGFWVGGTFTSDMDEDFVKIVKIADFVNFGDMLVRYYVSFPGATDWCLCKRVDYEEFGFDPNLLCDGVDYVFLLGENNGYVEV